jgi:hypothetical protein
VKAQLTASLNWSRNQIQLRDGRYTTDLVTVRAEYAFSTMTFANALVQYYTDAHEWSSKHAVQHHPPSTQRFLPRLQRAARFQQQEPARSRARREDDIHDGVLNSHQPSPEAELQPDYAVADGDSLKADG